MVVGYGPYPSSVEVDCVVLPRWHCKVERGVQYSFSGLEILLGEGGDVELGARTSKHIIVFAFDPISLNPLSLFVLCIALFILPYHSYCLCCLALFHSCYIIYMLGLLVCASLVLNHKSFI